MLSAAPVGRYLLDLHGEDRSGYPASDALCNALQVINHLQDCRDDFRKLDRVYLPLDWLEDAGESVAAIEAPRASIGLRRVIDQCLDGTEALMAQARLLPRQLRHRRLAYESGAIVALAFRLIAMLRRRDPIAERVELAKPSFLAVAAWGVFRTIVEGPQHSGSAPRATAE